jgi:hypothetical protein
MSNLTPDQSTNIYPQQAIDTTGLAVAIGRIEANQGNDRQTLVEIKHGIGGLVDTVTKHTAQLAVLEDKSSSRAPWYVIVGGIASIAAIVLAVWALFHP